MAEFIVETNKLDGMLMARVIHKREHCDRPDGAAWWTNSPTYYCPWCGVPMTPDNTHLYKWAREGWAWWWDLAQLEHADFRPDLAPIHVTEEQLEELDERLDVDVRNEENVVEVDLSDQQCPECESVNTTRADSGYECEDCGQRWTVAG